MDESGRLTRLEERYAHLQQHQTQQDKAMLALGDEVLRLKKELAALRALSSARPDAAEGEAMPDERPPHY